MSMIAAACGDDDDGGSAAPEATEGDQEETTSTTEAPDEGEPVPGGRLVYAVEADVASPWTPANVVCDISCHMIMRTVFDTMALYVEGPDGDPVVEPNLLESFTPNDDFTSWTLTPRQGVTFHDGTPFDAAAIKANLEAHQNSFLTGKALADVEAVEVVGTDAVVQMRRPWAHFPGYLTGQTGYIASPTWLAAVADGSAQPDQPVGTGPFVFESYQPGGSFVATKNADYWRASEGLPHLDAVEMRVIADTQARRTALLNGEIDMTHTSIGDTISQFRNDDIELTESTEYGEASYILLNNANPDSATQDVRIRRALAHALDLDVLIERRGGGVGTPANGPFGPGQLGELDDTGYPEFDQEKARELVEEYKADEGIDGAVPMSYTTTSDPQSLGTAELLKQFWDAVGFQTEIAQIEQSQFIVTALQGDFEAFGWRNHGGYNPDAQHYWWHSEAAVCGIRDTCPDGDEPGLALNFGRIRDPEIDASLDRIRETEDMDVVAEEGENISRRFGDQVFNLWTTETTWAWAKQSYVDGIDSWTSPAGSNVLEFNGFGGAHGMVNLWCNDGTCG
jgi:peptide/nickel transport system substrate-binding protein